jgi:hypothetical protein
LHFEMRITPFMKYVPYEPPQNFELFKRLQHNL